MKRGKIQDVYELTPTQQATLFHSLNTPGVDVYNVQLDLTLHGHIDVQAFHRACQQVVARYPALRTGFAWDNLRQSYQIVSVVPTPSDFTGATLDDEDLEKIISNMSGTSQ